MFAGKARRLAAPSNPGIPGNPRTFLPGCGAPCRSGVGGGLRRPKAAVSPPPGCPAPREPREAAAAPTGPCRGEEALRVPCGEGAWPRRAPLWAGYPGPLEEPSNPGNPGNPRTFLPGCGAPSRSGPGSRPWGQGQGPPGASPGMCPHPRPRIRRPGKREETAGPAVMRRVSHSRPCSILPCRAPARAGPGRVPRVPGTGQGRVVLGCLWPAPRTRAGPQAPH